jgi:hypothetical protein
VASLNLIAYAKDNYLLKKDLGESHQDSFCARSALRRGLCIPIIQRLPEKRRLRRGISNDSNFSATEKAPQAQSRGNRSPG